MKKILFINLLFIQLFVFSQDYKTQITNNIHVLEQALIDRNMQELERLLHPDLSFGHSNAWIETQNSLLKDLRENVVSYASFEHKDSIEFVFDSPTTVITRRTIIAKGKFKHFDFDLLMNVLEVWFFNRDSWQLLARQGVKIS